VRTAARRSIEAIGPKRTAPCPQPYAAKASSRLSGSGPLSAICAEDRTLRPVGLVFPRVCTPLHRTSHRRGKEKQQDLRREWS
jgi:hypothetical protein